MPTAPLTDTERTRAFAIPKKPDVIDRQRLAVRYHVEDFEVGDRPRRFLEALRGHPQAHELPAWRSITTSRISTKCARCTVNCQVYQATGDDRDIPCHRSELLLAVYRRTSRWRGILRGRVLRRSGPDRRADVNEMAEDLLRLHRLPPLQVRVPDGDRPRPHHPPRPLRALGDRHRPEGARGQHARAARRQDRQHLGDPGAGPAGHLRVPRGGDAGREADRDPVSRSTRRARSTSSSRRSPTSCWRPTR